MLCHAADNSTQSRLLNGTQPLQSVQYACYTLLHRNTFWDWLRLHQEGGNHRPATSRIVNFISKLPYQSVSADVYRYTNCMLVYIFVRTGT